MPRKMKTIAIANSFFSCPIFGINMCTRSRCACLLLRACTDVLFSSFFCCASWPPNLLWFVVFCFVCLAVWRLLKNANARERYPFVVRYYWQQKTKSKVRFFIVVSLFRRFIQSTAGRREKERERERKRSSFVFVVFRAALNYDSFFSPKIFPPFSSSLSSSFEARADWTRWERENHR